MIGHWAISRECQIPALPPPPGLLSSTESRTCVGCDTRASISLTRLRVTCLMTRARCLLFDSHMGHILFPVWADTHSYTHTYTRTATCRTLYSIGVRADVPTLNIYIAVQEKRSESPTVTARIHAVNGRGIVSVQRIIARYGRAQCGTQAPFRQSDERDESNRLHGDKNHPRFLSPVNSGARSSGVQSATDFLKQYQDQDQDQY